MATNNSYFSNLKDFKWIQNKTNSQLRVLEQKIMDLYVETYELNLKKLRDFYSSFAGRSTGKISYTKIAKYNRLKKLNEEIMKTVKDMYTKNSKLMTRGLRVNMQLAFNGAGWVAQNAVHASIPWTGLNEEAIKLAINNPISGLTLNETLNVNRNQIVWNVKRTLVQNMMRGEAYEILADKLKNVLMGDYKKALRIVRTESHRVVETAHYLGYLEVEDQGLETEKQWIATLDNKTRDSHASLDGTQIPLKEDFISILGNRAPYPGAFGVAEEDVNCRCTVIQVYATSARNTRHSRTADGETGKYVPWMPYNEWVKTLKAA